jgi:hypothetical protein
MASSVELGKRHLEEFNDRSYSPDSFRDYVAEGVVISVPSTGQELHGYEGLMQFNGSWVQSFSNAQCEDIQGVDEGDHATLHFRGTGIFDGVFPTPQGTVTGDGSHRVDLPFTNHYWVENGKITRIEGNFDVNELVRQMGLS